MFPRRHIGTAATALAALTGAVAWAAGNDDLLQVAQATDVRQEDRQADPGDGSRHAGRTSRPQIRSTEPDRVDKVDQPHRPDKVDKVERVDRPDRGGRRG